MEYQTLEELAAYLRYRAHMIEVENQELLSQLKHAGAHNKNPLMTENCVINLQSNIPAKPTAEVSAFDGNLVITAKK